MQPKGEFYREAVRQYGTQAAAAKALGVDPAVISKSLKRASKREGAPAANDNAGDRPPSLLDFASPADLAVIHAGTGEVADAIKRTRQRAAAKGWAPEFGWDRGVPAPHVAKGVSTLYDGDGKARMQWVKSSLSDERARETLQIAVAEFLRPLEGLGKLPPPPKHTDSDLLNVYVMGDPHLGMLAWAKETLGLDYDLKIAEQVHVDAMRRLVADSPKAAQSAVVNLGDALHADNYDFLTQSGHRLDADSRFPRMIEVAVRTFKAQGEIVAGASNVVDWFNVSGNHDRNTAPWLNEALRGWWSSEPRLQVNTSPSANLKLRFGKVLLGFTHGDRTRGKFGKKRAYNAQDFLSVMATDWSEDWGATVHRYGLQGHIHSSNRIAASGGYLESFETLASSDAWHAAQVYRSGQSMTRITFHREHGEIGRGRVPVSMVWKEAA